MASFLFEGDGAGFQGWLGGDAELLMLSDSDLHVAILFGEAAAGPVTYYKTLGGTLTISGNPAKKSKASLKTGSITPSGTLAFRLVFRVSKAGTITPQGSLARRTTFRRRLQGTITAVGAVRRKLSRRLSGAITAVGGIRRKLSRRLSGALTPTGQPHVAMRLSKRLSGAITASSTLVGDLFQFATEEYLALAAHIRRFIGRR